MGGAKKVSPASISRRMTDFRSSFAASLTAAFLPTGMIRQSRVSSQWPSCVAGSGTPRSSISAATAGTSRSHPKRWSLALGKATLM